MAVPNPFEAPNLDSIDLYHEEYLRSPEEEEESILQLDKILKAKADSPKKKKRASSKPKTPAKPKASPKRQTKRKEAPEPTNNKRATKVQKFVKEKSKAFYTKHTQTQREKFLVQKRTEITYEDIPDIMALGQYFEVAPSPKPKVDLEGRLNPLQQVILASKLTQTGEDEDNLGEEIEW